MHRARNAAIALERAQWLAELASAIEQAQSLACRLALERNSDEARHLYARLEAAHEEVDSLRLGDWTDVREEIDPKWLNDLLGAGASHAPPAAL